MRAKKLIALAAFAAAAGASFAPVPGHAKEMHLVWTTFMRNYPSVHAMVIDEIAHDRVVTVLGCNASYWCKVQYGRAEGYIEEGALFGEIGRLGLRGPLNPDAGCFWANQPAYVGSRAEEFCGVHANTPSLP